MTERKRRPQEEHSNRGVPNNAPHVGDLDTDSTEEMEQVQSGWRAEDATTEKVDVADNGTHVGDLEADADDLEDVLESAADALTDMGARERRRDQYYRTGGDDHNPGFDSDIDTNAPKEDDMESKRPAGNRGKSDWH